MKHFLQKLFLFLHQSFTNFDSINYTKVYEFPSYVFNNIAFDCGIDLEVMGIPKFYRWISERYPCLSQVIAQQQVKRLCNGSTRYVY